MAFSMSNHPHLGQTEDDLIHICSFLEWRLVNSAIMMFKVVAISPISWKGSLLEEVFSGTYPFNHVIWGELGYLMTCQSECYILLQ